MKIWLSKSAGCSVANDGLVLMSQLQEELQCCHCMSLVCMPILQCRKGHLCCSGCRKENSCRICKQTFMETQNAALERLLSFIHLPCKYRWNILLHSMHLHDVFPREAGCQESVPLAGKADHESCCQYRSVRCQYEHHGCEVVTMVKVGDNDQWYFKLGYNNRHSF